MLREPEEFEELLAHLVVRRLYSLHFFQRVAVVELVDPEIDFVVEDVFALSVDADDVLPLP